MRRVALSVAAALAGAGFGSDSLAQEPAGLAPRLRAAALAASPTVLVPTRLPEGWWATRAEAVATGPESYRLVYHGPDGACFAIENGLTFDRVGEPALPEWAPVEIPGVIGPAGGDPYHLFWSTGEEGDEAFPGPVVRSSWISSHGDAHRLVSPVEVPGGCDPVSPGIAREALESAILLTADGRPDPSAFMMILYEEIPAPDDRSLAAVSGETPEQTARRALAALGLPGTVDSDADELGVDEEVAVYEDPHGGGTAVLFTRTGGGDDSVAGVRYLVWIAEIGPGVIQYRAGRQLRCRSGRGHRSWGAGPCL